jgi:hypothetical protein
MMMITVQMNMQTQFDRPEVRPDVHTVPGTSGTTAWRYSWQGR